MGLSTILLSIFLTLYAVTAFAWAAIASWVLGIFALATAIALLIEAMGTSTAIIRRR